jgi:hypothetical protein
MTGGKGSSSIEGLAPVETKAPIDQHRVAASIDGSCKDSALVASSLEIDRSLAPKPSSISGSLLLFDFCNEAHFLLDQRLEGA